MKKMFFVFISIMSFSIFAQDDSREKLNKIHKCMSSTYIKIYEVKTINDYFMKIRDGIIAAAESGDEKKVKEFADQNNELTNKILEVAQIVCPTK